MRKLKMTSVALEKAEKRTGIERRQFSYSYYIPERRKQDRRSSRNYYKSENISSKAA